MALELNIGDVLTGRLNFAGPSGTVAFNVLHFELASAADIDPGTDPFTGVDMEIAGPILAQQLYDNLAGTWADCASSTVTMTGATIQNIYPPGSSRQYHYVDETPTGGVVAGDSMPLQDSPCIVKRTAFGERWGVGRFFFVGVSESQQAGGTLTLEAFEDINIFASLLTLNLEAEVDGFMLSLKPILFAQPEGLPVRKLRVMEAVLTDRVIKTQRRRRPGKGM